MIIVRYADDFVVGFQHEADARRFWADLAERFAKFGLELHPDKTRLIEFGRYAAERAEAADGASRRRSTSWASRTSAGRPGRDSSAAPADVSQAMRRKLEEIKATEATPARTRPEVGRWLRTVVRGHFNYHAVPGNNAALSSFRYQVIRLWRRALSQAQPERPHDLGADAPLAERWLPPATSAPLSPERLCLNTQGKSRMR